MGYTDYGIEQFGSFLGGLSPSAPAYVEFGAGSELFNGSVNYLESGILRNAVTWAFVGSNMRGQVQLATTDAVGSNIQEFGIGVGASVGSDLYTRDLTAIGDKTSAYSVTLSYETRIRRP